MTTLNCPAWCCEPHDPADVEAGSIDHTASLLHDLGGAYVGLHRLDVDGVPGEVRVVCDPGPVAELTPQEARRLAGRLALSSRG
jgi:hypothetical protein